jgi:hypothetical protein
MKEMRYEPPKITSLGKEEVYHSPDTSMPREWLRKQRSNDIAHRAVAGVIPRENIKAVETLQQIFPGADNTEKIGRLRPNDEDGYSAFNLN